MGETTGHELFALTCNDFLPAFPASFPSEQVVISRNCRLHVYILSDVALDLLVQYSTNGIVFFTESVVSFAAQTTLADIHVSRVSGSWVRLLFRNQTAGIGTLSSTTYVVPLES